MRKKLFIALALVIMILFSVNLYAQEGSSSRIGFQLGGYLPVGDWSSVSSLRIVSVGIGGSVLYDYKTTDKISITGAVGYYHFLKGDLDELDYLSPHKPIDISGNYYTYTIVPFLAGVKYAVLHADKTFQPYIGCELGFLFVTSHTERMGTEGDVISTDNGETLSRFVFAPAVGLRFKLGTNVDLDINAKWAFVEYRNYTGLNFGMQYDHAGINLGLLFRI